MKVHPKLVLALFFVCSTCVVILLSLGYAHDLLSPRGLGLALLIACLGIGVGWVLIVRRIATKLVSARKQPAQAPSPITAIARFVFGGGLLILLAPYVVYMAATKVLPWSVAIIAVPAYAFLSYGAYQRLRTRLVRRQGAANSPINEEKQH